MILLTDWAAAWKMTGMGVGIVFAILVILVLILQIMGFISAHTKSSKPAATSGCTGTRSSEVTEQDLAAVATAVHLYQNDLHDNESGILTWHPTETGWHSELNPSI